MAFTAARLACPEHQGHNPAAWLSFVGSCRRVTWHLGGQGSEVHMNGQDVHRAPGTPQCQGIARHSPGSKAASPSQTCCLLGRPMMTQRGLTGAPSAPSQQHLAQRRPRQSQPRPGMTAGRLAGTATPLAKNLLPAMSQSGMCQPVTVIIFRAKHSLTWAMT